MKHLVTAILLAALTSTIFGYTPYNSSTDETDHGHNNYSYLDKYDRLPKQQHITPNGRGGFTWYENPTPRSKNSWENLPERHSIEPDGHGGYYHYGN